MGTARKLSLYMMIPVAAMLLLFSLTYFSAAGFSPAEVLLCTLENTVMAFIARPTVSAFNAFKTVDENYTWLEVLITHLYAATTILAPILTTTTVITGFQAYILDFWFSIRLSFRKKLFIIGDGSQARALATKYSGRYNVRFLMPSDASSKSRLPLLKQKVHAILSDYGNILPYLKEEKAEKASCVVLNFKNWFNNYKGITDVIEYLVQYSKEENTPVNLIDAPALYQDIFRNMYLGFCKKYGRPESVLSVQFINTFEKNAEHFFEHPNLTEQKDGRHHFVFVGIGRYGTAMYLELLHYMQRNSLWGTIDVFDRSIEQKVVDLIHNSDTLSFMEQISVVTPAEYARLSVEIPMEAGPLRVNFYQSSVGELNFVQALTAACAQNSITELFFCIDNISANFECYRTLTSFLPADLDIRIYFRVGPELCSSFDAIERCSDKYRHLPEDFSDIRLKE